MIVCKFGGAALADAAGVRRAAGIVADQLAARPVVVVSAHGGVTDQLLQAAERAAGGAGGGSAPDAAVIAARHRDLLAGLELPVDLADGLLAELADLLRGVRLVGAVSPKVLDHVASFGERLSARTFAACLRHRGVAATAVDAWDLGLRTDSAHGRARPLPDDGRIARAVAAVAGVPVVTGFVARDEAGNITTLGRNGSDYSAALIGAALQAAEIQVWKDVAGVHTADPRLVPAARPIAAMTFDEASELSAFGSRVLHPATMAPAMLRSVPVTVRSTRHPAAPGTRIVAGTVAAGAAAAAARPVRAIAHRDGVALVSVTAARLLPQPVFLARLFEILAEHGAAPAPLGVSVGAVTFAVAADEAARLLAALQRLGDVTVERAQAVVGVVGDPRELAAGGAARVLAALAEARVPVRCAAQGAHGSTVAAVVPQAACAAAVRALHALFLEG